MDINSVLDQQTIITSTDINIAKTDSEIAAEDAEQQRIDFLNLLLTQLQNQNPLDPMDTDEYTAQLTRYSQLEQQIETNEKLISVTELLSDTTTIASFSYIGQEVELGNRASAVQDGKATWSYLIDGAADDAHITIQDANNNVVFEADGSTAPGAQSYTLDTTDLGLEEGEQLYFFVSAVDNNGNSYNTDVTSHVVVDGVWTNNDGQTYLTAGEISFLLSDVLRVET
ncbi:MAG: flagellar hook assembly protein FlgD [Alphaproteobacteria bacterium]